MNTCLFCRRSNPATRPEHIIPEALGNDELVLHGEVCDKCNQFFGSKLESFVLEKTPLAFWRTFLGIRTKHKHLPHVDLSQPRKSKGRLPAVHGLHDDGVGFTCHEDYSVSADVDNTNIIRGIVGGARSQFTFVFTPLVLSMMGRFFCKIGVELVCLDDPQRARSQSFDQARDFARLGNSRSLWPVFHGQSGTIQDLKKQQRDADGLLEEVFCYEYRLLEVASWTVLVFTVGTDAWIVSLNDPYPTPAILETFAGPKLDLIWYSPGELNQRRD